MSQTFIYLSYLYQLYLGGSNSGWGMFLLIEALQLTNEAEMMELEYHHLAIL